ncbi:MAG: hypothetical protein OEV66_05525 [Spirochaetia bacterium]|nr:hypothetical protein [Spirochaetia bacterium]
MERAFQEVHLFTWNYADHDLACLADFPDSRTFYSATIHKPGNIASVLYLSTCNRIEIYIETAQRKNSLELAELKEMFKDTPAHKGIFSHVPVYKRGLESVRHFFQVSAGLKSMALGETQITGQIKRDFNHAFEKGLISPFFNSLVQKIFECQKKIRTQTDIGRNPVSLVSLLEKEMVAMNNDQPLNLKAAAIGGTGDMSEKVFRYFLNKNISRFVIIRHDSSRNLPESFQNMVEIEKAKRNHLEIIFTSWDELWHNQTGYNFEVLVTATHAEKPILDEEKISLLKESHFLSQNAIIADLGIPHNVNTEGMDVETCRLVNLDRLLKQSKINKNLRGMHLNEALPIIEKAIHVFWMDYLYTKNPELVNTVLTRVDQESRNEWSDLVSGPLKNITEKQKRILMDYMKKQERRALRTHKELFVDMLTTGEIEKASANLQ